MSDHDSRSRIAAVVLNWRKGGMTRDCVKSLLECGYSNLNVIVVDNGSHDGSVEEIRGGVPGHVKVLESRVNLGFSRGCNVGIREGITAGADMICLVNNDLLLAQGGLEIAERILRETPHVGAVTGKIYTAESNQIWQAGGRVSRLRVAGVPRGRLELDHGQYDSEAKTGWASGAMSLFRTDVLQQAGLLPEEYFFGQEEWDLSTRLGALGYDIIYSHNFVGRHRVGASYATHPVLNSYGGTRNRHLYAEKYLSPLDYRRWRATFMAYAYTIMPLTLARVHGHDSRTHVDAVRIACKRHRPGRPVTLEELNAVSLELGVSTNWQSH